MNTLILKTLQQAKRLIVIVVGSTVLLMGIAMIALPGPAFLVIPVGLGVLATEFVWARSLGKKIVEQTQKYISKRKGKEPYPRNQVRKKRNTLPDRELEKRKKMPEEVHRALAEEEKKRLREFLYVRRPKCAMELSEPIMLRKPIVAAVLALTLVL